MVEAEIAFTNLEEIINLTERLIKYIINYVLDNNSPELEYLENYDEKNKKEIINKLKKIAGKEFKKIDYGESIKILKNAVSSPKNQKIFVFNDIK